MAKTSKNNKGYWSESRKINGWVALRDISTAAISKGQLPILIFGLVILLLVYKLDNNAASQVFNKILELLATAHLLGWLLSIIFLVAWLFHGRFQRKTFTDEISRLSEERNKLQAKLDGNSVESSV